MTTETESGRLIRVYSIVCPSGHRPDWLLARRTGVGASEAACLVGEDPRKSLVRLYLDKVSEEPPDDTAVEMFDWGLRHERTLRLAYSEDRYSGRGTWDAGMLLRSDQYQWALATIDAWTNRAFWKGEPNIPLELKTTEIWHADDWVDGCPRRYWWQLQHQMLVTGAAYASIACLIGVHRFVWDDVTRSEDAIARLVAAGERFWGFVQRREIPPGPMDAATLSAAYPSPEPATVQLDGEWLSLDADRESARWAARAQQRVADVIDDRLRGAIGNAERAVLPNGVIYTLKPDKRGVRSLRRIAPKETIP